MNDQHDGSELPELSDDDVRLLYSICQRASGSADPTFKALFSAYDVILREEELEQEHDGVIFRALLRVGESTVEANKKRQHVDLVERLEDVLEARGITLIRDDGEDEHTGTWPRTEQRKKLARRVSFHDARLEETWLSEHSEAVNPPSPQEQPPRSLLNLPPRRARHASAGRRARSTSTQRSVVRHPAPKSFQTLRGQDHFSDDGEMQNPTLHFEVSQTQLEIHADAMLAMSEVRLQRRTVHFLHDQYLQLQARRKQASAIAITHDRQILLKQALETWRGTLLEQRYERRHEQHFQHLERKAERARDLFLITKAFTHWATQCSDERFRTRIAQHYVLRAKYFKRWRAIAVESQTRIRSILCKKYVAIWRAKTARQSLSDDYAQAWYEERMMRRCKLSMFWEFCSRQVVDTHDVWIKRRAFSQLRALVRQREDRNAQALRLRDSRRERLALNVLDARLSLHQRDDGRAADHNTAAISSKCLDSMRAQARLQPLLREFMARASSDLKAKALHVWHHHFELERLASSVRCRMLLVNASTLLNDTFRCRWVAHFDNARIKGDALYRMHLQTKAQKHSKRWTGNLLARALATWRSRAMEERDHIEYSRAVFSERQNRRRKQAGFLALNLAMRGRDDARRAALEFRNSLDVPRTFASMQQEHDRLQRLETWSQMALFYRLGTKCLRLWHKHTTEHKANRRRNAYARIRTKVKVRLVSTCFGRWHGQAMDIKAMDEEAERRTTHRLESAKADALVTWRNKAATIAQLEIQATIMDQDRLLGSAFGALVAQASETTALQQRLDQSKRATDLALLASALRRMLWESFKAARNHESAEALRLRNRDTHAKQMLRHWTEQAAAKRLPPNPTPAAEKAQEEPDSPSLRPASRAASRASATNTPAAVPPSSPPARHQAADQTPGYMRTPSRSRRAGRFRPLPTPAAGTPFAFNAGYLITTPAPLPSSPAAGPTMEGLTPQVTPFDRKLRAGGFGTAPPVPPSALRSSIFGVGGPAGGTGKSVRFAGSGGRFSKGRLKSS